MNFIKNGMTMRMECGKNGMTIPITCLVNFFYLIRMK